MIKCYGLGLVAKQKPTSTNSTTGKGIMGLGKKTKSFSSPKTLPSLKPELIFTWIYTDALNTE